jgi:hypothetical protein
VCSTPRRTLLRTEDVVWAVSTVGRGGKASTKLVVPHELNIDDNYLYDICLKGSSFAAALLDNPFEHCHSPAKRIFVTIERESSYVLFIRKARMKKYPYTHASSPNVRD